MSSFKDLRIGDNFYQTSAFFKSQNYNFQN